MVDIAAVTLDGKVKSGEDVFLEAFELLSSEQREIRESEFFSNDPPKLIQEKLNKKYGHKWSGWLPETVRNEIIMDYGSVPESIYQKIFSIKQLSSNDEYWNNPAIFQKIILALNGVMPDFGNFQYISPAQICYGMVEANKVRSYDFNDIVKIYVKSVLEEEGIYLLPRQIDFSEIPMTVHDGDFDDEETPSGIQSSRLRAIDLYIAQKE